MTIAAACHIPADTYAKDEKLHIRNACTFTRTHICHRVELATKLDQTIRLMIIQDAIFSTKTSEGGGSGERATLHL